MPFAAFFEGGAEADVRPILDSDNRGSGGSFRGQINSYGPDKKRIPDGSQVDLYGTTPILSKTRTMPAGQNSLTGRFYRIICMEERGQTR